MPDHSLGRTLNRLKPERVAISQGSIGLEPPPVSFERRGDIELFKSDQGSPKPECRRALGVGHALVPTPADKARICPPQGPAKRLPGSRTHNRHSQWRS